MSASSNDPVPGRSDWLVPALLAAAIVAVVGVAEVRKRHRSTTESATESAAEVPDAQGHLAAPGAPPADAPAQIEASHVLVMYHGSMRAPESVTRTRAEALTRARDVLRRARAGEDFTGLARQFSDEPGASERGGALGTFGRGMMVGPFENAAFSLRVGQISDLVETPFGFHVIKRTR